MVDGQWSTAASLRGPALLVTASLAPFQVHFLRGDVCTGSLQMSGAFQDLRVWQDAMSLAAMDYRTPNGFPRHELYGMMSQMRRAAVSVTSNIAEGKGHRSDREFVHYLYHARGSLYELQTQVLLAHELAYLSADAKESLIASITTVARSLTGLIRSMDCEAAVAGKRV